MTRNPTPQRGRVLRIEVTPERWGLIVLAARLRGQKVRDWIDATIDLAALEARSNIESRKEQDENS
jgi:hypothetical protein